MNTHVTSYALQALGYPRDVCGPVGGNACDGSLMEGRRLSMFAGMRRILLEVDCPLCVRLLKLAVPNRVSQVLVEIDELHTKARELAVLVGELRQFEARQ